ncbi:hypothetical protein M513_02285, partial [Trichuris suis]
MGSTTEITFDIKLIPVFDGSSQPVAEWLEQLELICELSGIQDVSRIIPLRLVGGALAVYKQLPLEDRRKTEKIREALLRAFAVDSYVAYNEFIVRKLRIGEVPDVYLADLRRLADLAGGVSEKVLRSAFVCGLPSRIRQMMKAGARMESLTLYEVLGRVRAILVEESIVAATHVADPIVSPEIAGDGAKEEKSETYVSGKREQGGRSCAGFLPSLIESLPSIWIRVDGVNRRALVDSGCTTCIVHMPGCRRWKKQPTSLRTITGDDLRCAGVGTAKLEPRERQATVVDVIVSEQRPLGFDIVLGIHAIRRLGGMFLDRHGGVQLGPLHAPVCAAADEGICVEGAEFVATYEPTLRSWKAAWKWANGRSPGTLDNTKEEYPPAAAARAAYEKELETWIHNGWLVPYDEQNQSTDLSNGRHPTRKGEVRPVLDFRELNGHIDTFTANSDVCASKLREWRRRGTNVSILDLRRAYLQIRVEESLWSYQTVMLHGRRYCLTRLGFGLNVAPSIMKAVVDKVLSLAPEVSKGSSAYLDDIFVDESVVSARVVSKHLAQYGLESKSAESVWEGARVLGLQVWGEHDILRWKRGNE